MWFVNHALFKRFNKGKKTTYEEAVRMAKEACPTVETKTNGFVMVKGNKSVYDGDITYWSNRNHANNRLDNLVALHRSCHMKLKMST
jgi:hypothetical protein